MSKFKVTFITEDKKEDSETIEAKDKKEAREIFENDYCFRAILSIEYKLW